VWAPVTARIEELRANDFRCFESLVWQPDPGTNFLIGANAQGKTSILEAVCAVLRLQSPRTNRLQEAVRHGCEAFALRADIGGRRLQFRYQVSGRELTVDGVAQPRSDTYLQAGRVAWFANDHLQLVSGASAGRRRFLDFLASQVEPGYQRRLRSYDRALRSRNLLLRDGPHRGRELAAYDAPLVEHGSAILQTRRLLSTELAPRVIAACAEISGTAEQFDVAYIPGVIGEFAEALAASADEERRLRLTVIGPHRDDLRLTLDGKDADSYASEGQQRTLVLGMKLAQSRLLAAHTGAAPFFLLDDIFGELDPTRRNRLLAALPADAQTLITTTHLDWLTDLPATIFEVSSQRLNRIHP